MSKGTHGQREIEVIVNGSSCGTMSFAEGMVLNAVKVKALTDSKNAGQPPENWEIKDPAGNVLDEHKHLRDYPDLTQVWVSLQAGEGGR